MSNTNEKCLHDTIYNRYMQFLSRQMIYRAQNRLGQTEQANWFDRFHDDDNLTALTRWKNSGNSQWKPVKFLVKFDVNEKLINGHWTIIQSLTIVSNRV